MRAILLLCLLQASLAVPPFKWDSEAGTEIPKGECSIDNGSCTCCVMLKEVNRLKMHFDEKLSELEQEYVQTVKSLKFIEAGRVAASVALVDTDGYTWLGKFPIDIIIVYKHVFINLGDGYNPTTGIFTVPRYGFYSLALTIFGDASVPGSTLAACAILVVNDEVVAGSKEMNKRDQEDSASVVLALHLKAGDKVAVKLPRGCSLYDDSNHYNTFSVFLLYPTEPIV